MRIRGFKGALLSVLMVAALAVPVISFSRISSISATPDDLVPHDPIYINGNDNFTPANGVTSGSGTENDPYVIEGWDINAENAHGIWIRNTTAHFVIRNCYVHGGKENYLGIYFESVKNGKISDFISNMNRYGISLSNSDNNLIENCVNENNLVGVGLSHSDNNLIENCVNENNGYGVDLYFSSNNIISGCISSNNSWEGICVGGDDRPLNNIITNCVISNSEDGILFGYADNNVVTGCTIVNSDYGIFICRESDNNVIEGCTIRNNNYGVVVTMISSSNVIINNVISNNGWDNGGCGVGIDSGYNYFYHNNFKNNRRHACMAILCPPNYWDNNYPSGGNYWDDYGGGDGYQGPNQDIPGSDGIGDTPHQIHYDLDVFDYYPFVTPVGGEFNLATLYKVSLSVNFYFEVGSKLVVKFYKYDKTCQAESVFENFAPPARVAKFDNVPHPLGEPVQRATLVLTTDNTAEVISEIASFTVHQSDLRDRYMTILLDWFEHPELHDAFRAEIIEILLQWFSAPP